MDKELYDLLDNMTADELMSAGELLEELAENTSLPEDTGLRIRASVLKKAGFEMKNTIKMNKANDSITDIGELNTVRRGHQIIAACAALVIAAAAVGSMIFGSRLNAMTPGSDVTEITETAEPTVSAESAETSESMETAESVPETDIPQTADSSEPKIAVGELAVIPDVKGMSAEEAEKALSDAGFVPIMRNVFDEAPAGEAVSTSPAAEQKLKTGIEVECRISIGDMERDYEPLDVWELTDEEARAKIEEAGFIPESVEVFSAYYPIGTVCGQESDFCSVASQPLPGSVLKYYVSGSSETTKDIPNFGKVVYEDDEIVITADKLLCDGNFYIMHLKEETKDGSPINEFYEKWGERLRYADTGERVAYNKGEAETNQENDSTVGGAYLSWAVDDTISGKELTFDLVDCGDNMTYKSETRKESVRRDSFTIDTNIPTRTLTADNGLSVTLSPMGLSWVSDSEEYKADASNNPFLSDDPHAGGTFIITKDGRRVSSMEYYLSSSFGFSIGRGSGDFYYAYTDIDEVEAVELNGIIYK